MKPKAKPRSNAIDPAFYEALGDECDRMLAEHAGRVGWRIQSKALAGGGRERVSVCGRFRIMFDPKPRGRHAVTYRAERRVEDPPESWRWQLLSEHRTELAAKEACQRAAAPPANRKRPTSRPSNPSSPN